MASERSFSEELGRVEPALTLLKEGGRFDTELRQWMAGLIVPDPDVQERTMPDDPDGGEYARLIRPDLPPDIGFVALREPRELMMTAA